MKKRYQVFVSSTFADLKEERKLVMQAVLERKCFPAGMELFPAMDKKQFDYIKQVIDDSDYYLLIIGVRYGSLDDDKVSFTEKEYDYAVSKGIPVIAFLPSDNSIIHKVDVDESKQEKLKAFKEKVKSGRLVKFWDNAHDLKAKVISSLVDVFEDQPQIGWVRSNAVASAEAQKEIDRLQKEITRYQDDLKKFQDDLKEKGDKCQFLETSNQEAQQEIATLQKKIKQLQEEVNKLKAQEEQNRKKQSTLEQSYQNAQDKISDVASDLESLLKKLKGGNALEKSSLVIDAVNAPGTDVSIKLEDSKKSEKMWLGIDTITVPGTDVSFNMVHVEGGTFMMGANDGDSLAKDNEKPAHQVTLSDYWIGETQVTQELWKTVMGKNPSNFTGDSNRPVECVSWVDCKEFIRKLNKLTGKKFRLPTEAEWEFAARGGNKTRNYIYAGSNDIFDVARFNDNSGKKTHPVGELDPNELGLYDMCGNVWEWCQDIYGPYSEVEQTNPFGSSSGNFRVYRGGSYCTSLNAIKVFARGFNGATKEFIDLGLRLAL